MATRRERAPRSCEPAFEPREKRPHRLAAMRAIVLPRRRKLGSGEPRFGIQEMRVVAETAGTARGVDDRAVPAALGQNRLGILAVAHQRQHAVIMRAAIGLAGE